MSETRPGWKTTEFWLVLAGNVLINVGAIDVGGAKYRGLFAVLSVVGYSLARGLAKNGVPASVEPLPEIGDAADTGDDVPDVPIQPTPLQSSPGVFNITGTGVQSQSGNAAPPMPEGGMKAPDGQGD
jgi:hypothetical protein